MSEVKMSEPQFKAMIETHSLIKNYHNGVDIRVLDSISLIIQSGEFVAICGPSGSGKSTLLNLIGTLDTPTSGEVWINGVDVRSVRGDALADFRLEHIGFVFQAYNLVPALSVLENVMLPLIPHRRRLDFSLEDQARSLLALVGLGDRLRHFPGQLSGGEQQRVAIARALINTPRIILADEPTGNLDSKSGLEVFELLKRFHHDLGVTVVMVTHNEVLSKGAERLLRLVDGRLM
jgi:ABC-type lipoprotein export system ATPase subunit